MENQKPNNFKEAALSHIPQEFIQSMLKETKVETDGMGFLEAIAKNTSSTAITQKAEIPQQEQFTTIVINNVALKVSIDPYKGAMAMLLYLAAMAGAKDKKVAKVLKAFNFNLQDANGVIIYPKQKGKKK
jgi:hypothetical protein